MALGCGSEGSGWVLGNISLKELHWHSCPGSDGITVLEVFQTHGDVTLRDGGMGWDWRPSPTLMFLWCKAFVCNCGCCHGLQHLCPRDLPYPLTALSLVDFRLTPALSLSALLQRATKLALLRASNALN